MSLCFVSFSSSTYILTHPRKSHSSSSSSRLYSEFFSVRRTSYFGSSSTTGEIGNSFNANAILRINCTSDVSSIATNCSHKNNYTDELAESSISDCSSAATGHELGESDSDDDGVLEIHHEQNNGDRAERWHVLGLGQAMVDFSGMVDDEFLDRLGLEKGKRKVVNHEERGRVLRAMDGCSYKAAAGGSLSNSLVALARLGGSSLNIGMAGSVGSDPLGEFYRSKLRRANVNFLSAPVKDGTTGTVIVLTTPDAQRTMLAYQGTSSRVDYDPSLASLMSKTSILIVEGYLFEFPDTIRTIAMACKEARRCGTLVAITASDVTCIERHYDDFWDIMANYTDILFTNSDEARTFCHFSSEEGPVSATRYLSHFVPFVSVTDGPKGSYIGVKGEAIYIPPSPCVPVDTCGAGDAYASGILYGILHRVSDLTSMGALAAKVASVVVSQQGTRLRVQDAVKLSKSFADHHETSTIWSDGAGSMQQVKRLLQKGWYHPNRPNI